MPDAPLVLPAEVDEAFYLTEYAVQTRYPGIRQPVTAPEAERAILAAQRVLRWVEAAVVMPEGS